MRSPVSVRATADVSRSSTRRSTRARSTMTVAVSTETSRSRSSANGNSRDHAAHQRVDLGASALEHGFAAREPVRVEDVADRVLHPLGLRHQLVEQSLVVLALLIGWTGFGRARRSPRANASRRPTARPRPRSRRWGSSTGPPRTTGSELVATFGGLLEARERSLGLEQARPGIGGFGLGLDGERRHLLLELLVAPREPTRRRHRLLELVPEVRQLFLYGGDLRGVRVVGATASSSAVTAVELGRQVLGLGPRGLELRGPRRAARRRPPRPPLAPSSRRRGPRRAPRGPRAR